MSGNNPPTLAAPPIPTRTMTTRRATKTQHKAAFDHIVCVLMDLEPTDLFYLMLKRDHYDKDVDLFLTLDPDDAEDWSYTNDNGVKANVPKYCSGKLKIWQAFLSANPTTSPSNIPSITIEEYDDFFTNTYLTKYAKVPSPRSAASTPTNANPTFTSPNPTPTSTSARDLWSKRYKRDVSVFPVLKQDSQYDNWHLTLTAMTRGQGCGEILDSTYRPQTNDDLLIFDEQQTHMFQVFCVVLQTDATRDILRSHMVSCDAQTIYKEVVYYFEKAMKASLDGADILQYITTTRLGEGSSWKGTTHNFILHFKDQCRLLRQVTDTKDHLSKNVELQLLQTAVKPIPELAAVKNQSDHLRVHLKSTTPYEDYMRLLISAAQQYDRTFKKSTYQPRKRLTYQHELGDDDDSVGDPSDNKDIYHINAHDRGRRPP